MKGPPTHRLVLTSKDCKQNQTRAGVGWENEKGWISLKLNPGIVLNHRDMEDLWVNLYPIGQQNESNRNTDGPDKSESNVEFTEDDIPF